MCRWGSWLGEQQAQQGTGASVRPDGYGRYLLPDGEVTFYLEVDRATEPTRRVKAKLDAYKQALAADTHRDRGNVLLVCDGRRRLANLARCAPSGPPWVHEVETLRRIVRPKRRWPQRSYSAVRRLSCYKIQAATWREQAQKRNGGSNDLYLALAAAAMRRYWETVDLDAEPLQIVMPMNVRDADEIQDGGNVTGVGVVALSGDAAHLTDLSVVRKQIGEVKEGARHQQRGIIDAGIGLLPGSIRARVQFREFSTRDIVASSVPMPIAGELGDIPFEMMFMVAPAIGAAVSFTLTSHGDSLYLATNADLGIIHAPQRFDECVVETLESVLGHGAVAALRGGAMSSATVGGSSLAG